MDMSASHDDEADEGKMKEKKNRFMFFPKFSAVSSAHAF